MNETAVRSRDQKLDQSSTELSTESSTEQSDALVQRLADALGSTAGASAAYGEPVERDGVTVIPVAKVRWGVGGGSGNSKSTERFAGGGNGGMGATAVSPVGYIELHEGEAKFHRIKEYVPPWMWPPALLIGTLGVCAVMLGAVLTKGLTDIFNGFNTQRRRSE
jgi:hypothetical protein